MQKTELILGILIGAVLMFLFLHLLWRLGYYALVAAVSMIRRSDDGPQRRSRMPGNLEAMVLPRVQKDFPDFDADAMKAQAESRILQKYGTLPDFQILGICLNAYRTQRTKSELHYEASVSWGEKKTRGRLLDIAAERTEASPRYPLPCPGCGQEISHFVPYCSCCGAKLPEPSSCPWTFLEIREI